MKMLSGYRSARFDDQVHETRQATTVDVSAQDDRAFASHPILVEIASARHRPSQSKRRVSAVTEAAPPMPACPPSSQHDRSLARGSPAAHGCAGGGVLLSFSRGHMIAWSWGGSLGDCGHTEFVWSTMPQVAGWESCGEANTINGVGVDLVAGGVKCCSGLGSARRKGGGSCLVFMRR